VLPVEHSVAAQTGGHHLPRMKINLKNRGSGFRRADRVPSRRMGTQRIPAMIEVAETRVRAEDHLTPQRRPHRIKFGTLSSTETFVR